MASGKQLPRLDLLGGFRLTDGAGKDVRISGRKSRALLGALAVSPGLTLTRSRLKTLLWGDRGEQQAGDSLRQTLFNLKRELAPVGTSPLTLEGNVVRLDPQRIVVDVCLFRDAASHSDTETAAALYRGTFLDGLDLSGEEFEQWLRMEREALTASAIMVFERHVERLAGEEKAESAKRLLSLDPLREQSHRALMRAYAEQGEIALAKKQFEACRQLLEKELGVSPARETNDLLSRLMRNAPVDVPTPIPASEAAARPSLAVLPFTMLSPDPSQRYFSDGISQDIIIELSRFRQLRVHTHHVANKDEKDPVGIGRALGVQYVVEGSVRRIGERIRINTQLIEVDTGQTIWAERFDRDQEEIFSVQDQVVRTIVGTLVGRVKSAGVERASRKPPATLAAYECVLRADAFPIGVPAAEAEARLLYQKAISLDPEYARAYMLLANCLTLEWYRDIRATNQLLDQALELAQKALLLDENDECCHAMMGRVHMLRRSYDLAEYHHLKAFELNPNSVLVMTDLGILYGFLGEPERGVEYFKDAQRLDRLFEPTWYWRNRAIVHFIGRQYDEAIAGLNRSPIKPDWVHAFLAASHAYLHSIESAKAHASEVLRLSPDFSVNLFSAKDPFKRPQDRQHLADGLLMAGLPD